MTLMLGIIWVQSFNLEMQPECRFERSIDQFYTDILIIFKTERCKWYYNSPKIAENCSVRSL